MSGEGNQSNEMPAARWAHGPTAGKQAGTQPNLQMRKLRLGMWGPQLVHAGGWVLRSGHFQALPTFLLPYHLRTSWAVS